MSNLSSVSRNGIDAQCDNLIARFNRLPITRTAVLVLVLLQLAWIIEGIDIGVSGPVLFTLKTVWQLTPSELGALGAISTFGIVLGLLPAGYLADRFGRKRLAVWGLFSFTVLTALTALAPSYPWFFVLRLLTGLGQGVLFTIPYLMISEFIRPNRRAGLVGLQNGILAMSYVLPALLAAWVVSQFSPEWSWRVILLIAAIPIVYAPVLAIWLPESPRWQLRNGRAREAAALVERLEREAGLQHDLSLRTDSSTTLARSQPTRLRDCFSGVLLKRTIVSYSAYTGGIIVWYGVLTYGPIIFRAAGFNTVNSILMLAFMMFVGAFGNFTNGYSADRLGRKPTLAIFAWVSAASLVAMAFVHDPMWVIIAGAATAFFGLGAYPTYKIYLAEQYPTKLRGFGTAGGESCARFVGGVVATYYIPTLMAVGGTSAVFLLCAASTGILIIPALLMGRETANLDIEVAGQVEEANSQLSPSLAAGV